MLCLVHYFFIIGTSVIDCLGRFVSKMTIYVSSGTLNLVQLSLMARLDLGWSVQSCLGEEPG